MRHTPRVRSGAKQCGAQDVEGERCAGLRQQEVLDVVHGETSPLDRRQGEAESCRRRHLSRSPVYP